MNSMNLQCLLGMACKNFCILAADMTNSQSIILIKNDEEKVNELSKKIIIAVAGDMGDRIQFTQYVAKNMDLYNMRNEYDLDLNAVVHFTRKSLSEGLRTGNPFLLNMLIGGYDPKEGGELYFMDYLATSLKVPYAAHGLGGLFGVTILEKNHSPNLTEAQAYDILKLCVTEVHQRFLVNLPNFQVKVVTNEGVKTLPKITVNAADYLDSATVHSLPPAVPPPASSSSKVDGAQRH